MRIYELIGEKGDISPRQKEFLKLFSRGIETYLAGDWVEALSLFEDSRKREPNDAVSTLYIRRCEELIATPPDSQWRGYHKYTTK